MALSLLLTYMQPLLTTLPMTPPTFGWTEQL